MLTIFMLIISFVTYSEMKENRYDGAILFKIGPFESDKKMRLFHKTTIDLIDFWSWPKKDNDTAVGMVFKQHINMTIEKLNNLNVQWEEVNLNIAKMVKKERSLINVQKQVRSTRRVPWNWTTFPYEEYHDYNNICRFLNAVHSQFPCITKLINIGQSYEGRDMLVIKIGNGAKSIWIDAGIHAREWIAISTAVNIIRELLTLYDKGDDTELVKNVSWYILPILNPDGYQYSMDKDRLWRKSRSKTKSPFGCRGVDLNRNFDFDFGHTGTSEDVCSSVYGGPHSFSEPETRAVGVFLKRNERRFRAYVTLHSFSQLWLMPYGHRVDVLPPNIKQLNETAQVAAKALQSEYNYKYSVMTSASLYPASGDACDWVLNNTSINYSYTIELRPDSFLKGGFILPKSEITPTAKEVYAALLAMVRHIMFNETDS